MEKKVTFNIDKKKNFSEWYTEINKRAELSDLRYNVKGFVIRREWSTMIIEKMYDFYEEALQKKGHLPVMFPAVIPEENFKKESEHVEGFVPEVFWVTEHGKGHKLEKKLALRPTSETAFYQMYSIWIRSYKDLPFKRYQRANVFRCEGKATRPFLREREFNWIESHNLFETQKEAENQVKEDMQTTKEVLHDIFGIPFIFFERPQWDKFAGALKTFAADVLMPDGKITQQPSTHLLGHNFSKAFNVKFKDKDGKEKNPYTTTYGPCISRMFGSLISIHGDNKGLILPFDLAPIQIIIVPILTKNKNSVLAACKKIEKELQNYKVKIDDSDKTFAEKFYHWEMKGVPIRIEVGPRELDKKSAIIFRRDTKEKTTLKFTQIKKEVEKLSKDITKNIIKEADKTFNDRIIKAKKMDEVIKILKEKNIARVNFCSIDMDGAKCAEFIEKNLMATVRGKRVDKNEKPEGNCIVCSKKAKEVVYIAKSY